MLDEKDIKNHVKDFAVDAEAESGKNYIAMPDCVHGAIYKLHSRNLSYGAYDKEAQGFIGIRQKFGDRYLFTEYHWDTGGRAKPKKLICGPDSNMAITENSEKGAELFKKLDALESLNCRDSQ